MKIELFAVVLALMYLTVHCIPVDVKRNENGVRRSHRSNHAMVLVGYYGQPMAHGYMQESQFNAQSAPGEYGVNQNQEAPAHGDGNVQPEILQPNTPIGADQPIYDIVTEASNLDGVVTQKTEDAPAKESPESDEEEDDDDDEDEDESDLWDISKMGKKNRPTINFFPVSFGNGRNSGRSEGLPAGSVAIANSFSTGRRGVATSHANAGALGNTFRN